MFGWLFRKTKPIEKIPSGYEWIQELFTPRFPTGWFRSCDFRPHFAGFGHNAWIEIEPLKTIEATRLLAFSRFTEMIEFIRPLQQHFGPNDRIEFAVGFPIAIKKHSRRIYRGWIPTIRLKDVQPPDFAIVGGAFAENPEWFEELWD